MSAVELLIEAAGWIGLMFAALGLAGCDRLADEDRKPGTEWVVTMRGEAQDLDALEAAARDCGLGPIERRRDGDRKWLDIGLPAATGGKGGMMCLTHWMKAHPDADAGTSSDPVEAHAPLKAAAKSVPGPRK